MAEQTRQHPKLRLGRLVVCSVVVLLVALVVVNLTGRPIAGNAASGR